MRYTPLYAVGVLQYKANVDVSEKDFRFIFNFVIIKYFTLLESTICVSHDDQNHIHDNNS